MDAGMIAGEASLLLLFLLAAWFTAACVREGETRAWRRGLLLVLAVLLFNAALFLIPQPLRSWGFAAAAAFVALAAGALLFSRRPRREVEITGSRRRIDERDVIFARFDLEEDGPEYSGYYRRRPELEALDREIRRLPDLLDPAHVVKSPRLFSLAAAESYLQEKLLSLVDGEVAAPPAGMDPPGDTRFVKWMVRHLGADLCGVCRLDQAYLYSHVGRGPEPYGSEIVQEHPYAVVFAVEMDLAMVAAAPGPPVIVETSKRYLEAAWISIVAAHTIRRLGYSARAHIAGSNYQAVLPPLAWEAGLGELGRLGVLITSRYGPRARLGLVTTDMPLVTDERRRLGIQDFCARCLKCAVNCPARAIPEGDRCEENGVLKWSMDREACYRYWRKVGTDCARCIFVCPFSKPDTLIHRLIRRGAARSSLFQSLAVKADDFFYGTHPQPRKGPL